MVPLETISEAKVRVQGYSVESMQGEHLSGSGGGRKGLSLCSGTQMRIPCRRFPLPWNRKGRKTFATLQCLFMVCPSVRSTVPFCQRKYLKGPNLRLSSADTLVLEVLWVTHSIIYYTVPLPACTTVSSLPSWVPLYFYAVSPSQLPLLLLF